MNNHQIYEPPKSDLETENDFFHVRPKTLTVFLWLIIIINIGNVIYLTAFTNVVIEKRPTLSSISVYLLALCSFSNVIFAIALLNWKKWGFWGFCVSIVCIFSINTIDIGIQKALINGVPGFLLLFVLLHIGGKRKVWKQLE